ncbi:MAG: response regulator [Candidatus Rokubacteria bacterium]|nr:response regulator [Candidatus Rokubacteria bacterium]
MTGSKTARSLKLPPLQSRLLERATAVDGHVRVLLVEDDLDHAELVTRALERQDFDVTVVGDGPACLEAAAREPYALILLDYSLPRMNGLEVLAALRARGGAPPVVMVTAQGDERLAIEALKAGGIDFVVKTSGYLVALPTVLFKVLKQHELARENTRLHQETRRQLRDAEALVELDRALGSTLALKLLLETVGAAVARTCGMDRCFVLLCEGGRLVPAAAQFADGRVEERLAEVFNPDGVRLAEIPFVAEAVATRLPVVVNDPARDPRVPAPLASLGLRALLALPLVRQGEVVGALVLDRTQRDEPVSPAEAVFGAAAASHVALALDNARLYENAQQALADLKAAQEQLVRGETLRALGEVAGGVAHHLNNLLAVISGRSQLLLRSNVAEPIRRPLEIIERASKDGAEVVRRIQEFARTRPLEAQRLVDLNEVVDDVVEMGRAKWHDAAMATGVEIEVDRDLGAVPPVMGHAAALREVVMNLLFNAVDALPQGGRITLSTRLVGGAVVLSVADTGVGMPADVLKRAQEPFFTTKGVKSMGLGLSVSYGIVERHGGELTIVSSEGRGTTVTVRIPVEPAAGTPVAAPAPGARDHLRLLLIDDDAEVREALAELIEADGHSVVQAAGPHEGLAQLDAGLAPDLVLTDLGMPGMTGWELARAVKSRWPDRLVGVITGWGQEAAASSQAECTDFVLQKPLNLDALYAAIARARASGHDA